MCELEVIVVQLGSMGTEFRGFQRNRVRSECYAFPVKQHILHKASWVYSKGLEITAVEFTIRRFWWSAFVA